VRAVRDALKQRDRYLKDLKKYQKAEAELKKARSDYAKQLKRIPSLVAAYQACVASH
jgi:hypothetical protein